MWALMPLKRFDEAKQRLSSILTQMERRGLFQAMVQDVLEVLHKHPDIDGLLLISEDPTVQLLADFYQADYLSESSLGVKGLNGAVTAGVNYLAKKGIEDVMVIHGDLPLIQANDISHLVTTHRKQGKLALTLVPDSRDEGTNCLLCRPASTLTFCYGQHSFPRHFLQAEEKGLEVNIERLWGMSWDMDTPADLNFFIHNALNNGGLRTLKFLTESGIGTRIEHQVQAPPKTSTTTQNVVDFPTINSATLNTNKNETP